jgi:hypothetical protein
MVDPVLQAAAQIAVVVLIQVTAAAMVAAAGQVELLEAAALVDTPVRAEMVHPVQLQQPVLEVEVVAVLWVIMGVAPAAVAAAVPAYLVKALMEQQAVQPLLIVD